MDSLSPFIPRFVVSIMTIVFMVSITSCNSSQSQFIYSHGAIIRGDTTQQEIALIFTGGDFNDGGYEILNTLSKRGVIAGFFFTGDFYRNPKNRELISQLKSEGHYLGPHSDKHLLYCSWEDRDSLLVTKEEFTSDILANYATMDSLFGIKKSDAPYFIPPYEWYNDSIAAWSRDNGLVLFNYSPGTISHADYTTPEMKNYRSSSEIWKSITEYEQNSANGMNGFILLIHIGTHPNRTDKFYYKLDDLIQYLDKRGYTFTRIDSLLSNSN